MRTATARMSTSGIEAVMAGLARRDPDALTALLDGHGHALARAIGGIARQRGARLTLVELEELTLDAALELAELAGAWDPSGAPPWIWARHRLAAVVDRHIGQYATSLEVVGHACAEAGPGASGPASEPRTLDVVAGLAARHPTVALLHDAVIRVATPRDQEVFFETVLQATLGDRAPAVTVGRLLGMRPAAVRQQHRRVRLRVLALVERDPRYAPLADLPVLEPSAA